MLENVTSCTDSQTLWDTNKWPDIPQQPYWSSFTTFFFFFHEQKRQSRLYIVTLPLNKMRKPSNTNSSNYPRAAAVYLWLNIHRHVTLLPLRPPKRASKGAQWPIKWGLAGRHSPPIADHTLHCPNWHATLNLIGIFYLLSRSQVFLCYLLPD